MLTTLSAIKELVAVCRLLAEQMERLDSRLSEVERSLPAVTKYEGSE